MNWDLTPTQDGVMCGHFSRDGAQVDRHGHHITGLQPGLFQRELPVGESAVAANTFGRAFHEVKGQFPAKDFRTPGWSRWSSSQWWPRVTEYILQENREDLERFGLGAPIRATQLGLRNNSQQFFGVLELYNPDTRTFFTPDGELGIPLHEMAEVSGLPYGRYPYEEYVPGYKELTDLEKDHPQVVETYWEVMCHYHICVCIHGRADKKGEKSISHNTWAHYLFEGLDDKKGPVLPLGPLEAGALSRLVLANLPLSYVTSTDEYGFRAGTTFDSYLYQSGEPISSKAVLAGYLMLWLKHTVVPTGSFDTLTPEVIFPAVCLAHGRQYALLPAMIARIHWGLRHICYAFCHGSDNPRVELPYAYLMAWFVMHCPTLMGTPSASLEGQITPFIQKLENVDWSKHYMASVRRTLRDYKSYTFNRCLPHFPGASYGQTLVDEPNAQGYTNLSLGCFIWLMSIRPGYLICRFGPVCVLEPYLPCRFSRQLGYDQLYIGNPNIQLQSEGCGLIVGARAWYWTVAGGTGARFSLPQRDPQSRATFAYCKWHCMANAEIPGFNINSSGLRLIRGRYREGHTSTRSRIPGLKEYLSAEQSQPEARAEDSSRSSPHETQEEVEAALGEKTLPPSPRVDEYGSNIPHEEAVGAEAGLGTSGESAHSVEPSEPPQQPAPESTSPPRGPVAGQVETAEASALTRTSSKRTGQLRMKRVAKRPRREPSIEADTGSKSDDDVPLSQLHLRRRPAPETMGEGTTEGSSATQPEVRGVEGVTSAPETITTTPITLDLVLRPAPASISTSVASEAPAGSSTDAGPPATTALAIFTAAVSTVVTSPDQPRVMSPPATPTSPYDKSKEYGVSMIRNNFLAILRESPTQVLEHGGDFAGIKAVLTPLLGVMENLTSATATLPYWTRLTKVENLFEKWQSRRGESLAPMIEDRTMQLIRERDDSQFELERQILEKKQIVQELGETTKALFDENKRVAEAKQKQQLQVESYRAALADIQAKLAQAESALETTAEKHQTLSAQWTEHQKLVQIQSDDLEKLSGAVSSMQVLSDDELRQKATQEVETAHRETVAQLAEEIRRTVAHL